MSYTWCPEAYRTADVTSACFDPGLWVVAVASLVGAVLLSLAAAQDLVKRQASNAWWVLMLVPVTAVVIVSPVAFLTGLAAVGVALALYAGGGGGADVKAVVVTALLFPDPVLWLALVSCGVIGMGVWIALGLRRVPFLVPLASSVGLGLWLTGFGLFGVEPPFL